MLQVMNAQYLMKCFLNPVLELLFKKIPGVLSTLFEQLWIHFNIELSKY